MGRHLSGIYRGDDTLRSDDFYRLYRRSAPDFKVPLLRSLEAVDKASVAVCQYFDATVGKVHSYLGWEQEYFLVDEGLWAARPDLMLTGRTLIGHESAKTSSWKIIISGRFRPG